MNWPSTVRSLLRRRPVAAQRSATTAAPVPAPRAHRYVRRAAMAAVIGLVGLQAFIGTPAMAASCTEAPVPERPGRGMVGGLDPLTGNGLAGSVYLEYGYGGMVWHRYGEKASCMVDGDSTVSTWAGNQSFNIAKVITGATNGAYYLQLDNGNGGIAAVDKVMADLGRVLYNGVYTPWLTVFAAIAGITALGYVLRGNLAQSGTKLMWVVAGLGLASTTFLTPAVYTGLFDDLLRTTTAQLRTDVLAQALDDPSQGTIHVLPTLLHNQIVYDGWLAGEFGSADSPEATKFGRDLLAAQAWSADELAQHKDGDQAALDAKRQQFKEIAGQLKNTSAYPSFTGTDNSRMSAGLQSLVKAIAYSLFQLVCYLALFLAQFIIRAAVAFGPVIGLFSLVSNNVVRRVGKTVGSAVVIAFVLLVASLTHTVVLTRILDPKLGLSWGWQLVAIVFITIVMWFAVKPGRKLWQMITGPAGLIGAEVMSPQDLMTKRAQRKMRRAINRNSRSNDPDGADRWWTRGGGTGHEAGDRHAEEAAGTIRATADRVVPSTDLASRAEGETLADFVVHDVDDYKPEADSATRSTVYARAERVPTAPPPRPGAARPGDGGADRSEPYGLPAGAPPVSGHEESAPPAAPSGEGTTGRRRFAAGASAGTPPEVIVPSRYEQSGSSTAEAWLDAERAEQAVEAPVQVEDGKPVYQVYRPSTGQLENVDPIDTNPSFAESHRPELGE